MFCAKCGNQMPDGAAFCERCGARMDAEPTPDSQYYQNQLKQFAPPNQQPYVQSVQTKKFSGPVIFTTILVLGGIIAVLVFLGSLLGESVDYIASVKAMKPLSISDVTYEEIINNYFQSPKWKERAGENGTYYVDISGTPQNGDEKIVLTIRIDPTDDPEVFWYTPHRLMIGGRGAGESYADSFVYELYIAYKYGSDAVNLYKFMQMLSY